MSATTGATPFKLVPIIHELVRTRFPISGSIFLVENVRSAPLTKEGRWQVVRLLLSDGEFCIQAILGDAMHHFVHSHEIDVGSYVRVDEFQFRTALLPAFKGSPKTALFLLVLDLQTVGWNREMQQLHEVNAASNRGNFFATSSRPTYAPAARVLKAAYSSRDKYREQLDALADINMDRAPVGNETSFLQPLLPPVQNTGISASGTSAMPVALLRDWHDQQTPLQLTTLRSIPSLPYRQNWSCNVLAIVSKLSPVEVGHLPPHKQRVARITDPSTAKQVHLTVFLDPEEFEPKIGSAVLLTGVKNHSFDGGSLKKYASDRKYGKWWFQDPWELDWCDVKGIKAWWDEMEAYFASQFSVDESR